jgi:hypothetical protein
MESTYSGQNLLDSKTLHSGSSLTPSPANNAIGHNDPASTHFTQSAHGQCHDPADDLKN